MSRLHPAGLLFARLQPVLETDIQTILGALERCERLIVLLDGAGSAPSTRRPWSCAQREAQARSALSASAGQRATFIGLRDHLYQPARWVAAQNAALASANAAPETVALIATQADAASLALRGFSAGLRLEPVARPDLQAEAAVRAAYLRGGTAWRSAVPSAVAEWLDVFRADPVMGGLAEEQTWVDHLSESWQMAPYPPIFVTADPVVVAQGHILMVHRKNAPAKGLWALPGGFVEQDETVAEAALRELNEETGIDVPLDTLRNAVRGAMVFDHPQRSVRGRSITHGLFIDLSDAGPLPALRAGDDAASAAWWPLERFGHSDELIAEDHAWIVRAFVPDLP